MRYIGLILLIWLASGVYGQSGTGQPDLRGKLFYYYGTQKISLEQSFKHIYVQTATQAAAVQLSAGLQSVDGIAEFTIAQLAVPTRQLLKLESEEAGDSVLAWLRRQPGVEVARPAVYHQSGKDHLYEDAFYVRLKATTTTTMLQNEAARRGCAIVKTYEYDKRVFLLSAGATAAMDGLAMANAFYETGLFEYAEPDFRPLNLLNSVPNDPLFPLQWGLKNTGSPPQYNGVPGADIGIEAAWQITRGSPTIRIAVIDEGVQRLHPDLVNNIDPKGFGLVPSNTASGEVLHFNRSHGTACAGIISAESNNGIGVAGVAPLCKIIPVNLTINAEGDFGSVAQLATCIDWAWNQGGADILSNSWGGGVFSSLIQDAIKRASTLGRGGKGAVVLFSSANYDAGVSFPAIVPEAIAVGAMDMCYQRKSVTSCDGEKSWGSNYGVGLDVSAPGVKIATTINGAYTETFNGTSAACPFAAGVAALILSINPNYTMPQAREILERSTRKVGNYTYTRVPDQPNGSWSNELGYGMVNAHQAVLAAQSFDFACKVSIAANGPTQICTGSSVNLSITSPTSGSAYSWLRNGVAVQNGQNLSATTSGLYQAVIVRSGGCRDTSMGIEVRAAAAAGTLQARAGRDTTICLSQSLILGGSPSATGGTAFHHPLRGLAHEYFSNLLVRFNPNNPSTDFKILKEKFAVNNQIFVGIAMAPNGVYMLSDDDEFVKLDTATGNLFKIGNAAISGLWSGMTYNAVHQKIYGIAYNFTFRTNELYEINSNTGQPIFIGFLPNTQSLILRWLAADTNGDMYAMSAGPNAINAPAKPSIIYKINVSPLSATALPSETGFAADFPQDAEFNPISGKLLLVAGTNPLGSNTLASGNGLWEVNKTSGVATLKGAVGQGLLRLDALAFAGPEYKYNWSPAQYLSNPKDANPVFSGAPPGVHTYTLTVTDLCGRTAQSFVSVTVRSTLAPNSNGVLFVNAAATGNGSGSGWANAVPTLQQALLNLSNTCGTITQIWVAKGTYKPTTGANRDVAFTMQNNLAIYGGFAGTETQLSQRNIRNNPTILSGEIGLTATTTDNSYNVVRNDGNGLNSSARLDGFTITAGNAGKGDYVGSRGAGIFNRGSSPTYANCIIVGNRAGQFGGGMFSENGAPLVVSSVFAGNTAIFGGGLYNESATTRVVNCTFSANEGTDAGGAFFSFGAPVATIQNSIMWGNSSGILIAVINSSNAVVTNSLIQGGYAPGTNIINVNPLFVTQPSIGLGNMGDLRLQPCSPGINMGNNAHLPGGFTTDVTGGARIANNTIDMGAYERQIQTQASIIYVNANATGGNDGSNWTNAFTKLQDALMAARNCGSIRQVWVARGTYYPDEGQGITNNDRNVSFRLRDTLSLYGGFAGTETALSERNLALLSNASILSGEIQQDGQRINNSIQVVIAEGLLGATEFDGFTIQGGAANIVLPEILSKGAGLLVLGGGQPIFRNLTITDNAGLFGAAITVVNTSARFINCVVHNNRTAFGNGAIWNDNSLGRYFHRSVANNINNGFEQVVLKITGTTFPQIANSIIRGTSPAISGGEPFVVFSNIQHPSVWPGQRNINVNPLFVDEASGNLQLSRCSPAINVGGFGLPDIPTDFFGLPRVVGSNPDMGAFEFSAFPVILYVNASATGANNGSNWANAFTSLQDALTLNCPIASEIWVARGTYRPTTDNNRDSSFKMRNNLAINGGFAGTETESFRRNWQQNPTILSGDIGVVGNRSDNSYNVISNNNNELNSSAILDGFIIRDGQANKNEYARMRGGGMYNFNSSPLVRNCIFTNNFSIFYGGAVFNEGGSATPTFINSIFSGNQAQWGGGIYNESAQTRVINCTFSANQVAAGIGGAMYNFGVPQATIVNSIVWRNSSGIGNAAGNTSPIQVTHSIVQGGYTGAGNLNSNPFFLQEAGIGLGQLGDFRLLGCSPAINAGINAAMPWGNPADMATFPRIALNTIDMGAFERQTSVPPTDIFVDINATGLRDGRTWANAYNDLSLALRELNNCGAGNTPTIHIAAGTYTIVPPSQFFLDKLNAQILGGYPWGGGIRNAAINPVIIRGNVQVNKNVLIDGVRVERP